MRHALEKWEDWIEIDGKYYNNLRYADYVALLATTEVNRQQLVSLNEVGKASGRFGLSVSAKKTQLTDTHLGSRLCKTEPTWNKSNSSFTSAQAF